MARFLLLPVFTELAAGPKSYRDRWDQPSETANRSIFSFCVESGMLPPCASLTDKWTRSGMSLSLPHVACLTEVTLLLQS